MYEATSHAFVLLGYLPIPKFENVTQHEQSILKARTFHYDIGIMTQSLKDAEANGNILSDPAGHQRFVVMCGPGLARLGLMRAWENPSLSLRPSKS
jgi:hypothetical protein